MHYAFVLQIAERCCFNRNCPLSHAASLVEHRVAFLCTLSLVTSGRGHEHSEIRSPVTALQSRGAIEQLGDQWRIAILHSLQTGSRRTHQFREALRDVSPNMLTQTLRGMERDGLLNRNEATGCS
jgi:hypothetical protein